MLAAWPETPKYADEAQHAQHAMAGCASKPRTDMQLRNIRPGIAQGYSEQLALASHGLLCTCLTHDEAATL